MTEYFARLHRQGLPIDCGANPRDTACTDGSRQAAWLSSIFASMGSICNFILAPVLGQASDIYGRKPFLVLSQLVRVATPFSIMYFMQPHGSMTPYLILRLIDYGFGTAGVLSAAVADIVAPENRAAAFGILFASQSFGYYVSAFVAPFFTREYILRIAAGLFTSRVLWAQVILQETLPARTQRIKTQCVMKNPIITLSILFRNNLFLQLTCLIALTSFVTSGIFQIQSFYLNTIVGFQARDFGTLMLINGAFSLLVQSLLLKPLVSCFKEKGVVIIALTASLFKTIAFVETAFHPHKWIVYASSMPGSLSDLSFPAISAHKSINASEEEQGRLQGSIYGARSVFDALGPIIFSSLYATMTRQARWTQALPFAVAACIYLIGIGVALSLPVGKPFAPTKITEPIVPHSCCEASSKSAIHFETDVDVNKSHDIIYYETLNDDRLLMEPLL
ncbi:major facilitator superfamily [Plasmopara halstedii]|uniref:Major facilitator superfamily n=1 Tax=Plasmopara halstedii TaxID=4781 RepID=A0A0P1B2H6_PLAHL|nr:major facilitator superfamily [Plasmopara halstedii]CEG48348.1 major facilitator superfamily [Plasmopara halstedii]|eukprot:XP_024584717.1 major facilitator superfamily [Plasmopara halstedii]